MGEKQWWSDVGPFQSWNKCPSRPDPVEVLRFYLERRGIGSDEHTTYLMDLLGLQQSMAYNILRGEALDSISRCRLLVQALKIPPPLLGIDGKYYPIKQHPYWWKECGFSFHADTHGHPVMGEVIAYLRTQRTQTDEQGEVKVWSQQDLGDACGLAKEAAWRMEHDENPYIFESMTRRVIVASALGAGAGDMEPTIFRLFGLDPQAYRVPVPAHEFVPVIDLPYQRVSGKMLRDYQEKLSALFTEYHTSHAQNTVAEALEWIRQFSVLLSRAGTSAQRIGLLALQSRTHRLLACVVHDQCEEDRILFHMTQAIECAERSLDLVDPQLNGNNTLLVTVNELLASALFTAAMVSYELRKYHLAQAYIGRALNLFPALQSRHLKAELLGVAALIHAYTVMSSVDQQKVLSYIRRAGQIYSSLLSQSDPPDANFFQRRSGILSVYKARALSSPKMEGATSERVLDLLGDAQRLTDPAQIRQQVMIGYLQALAHFEAFDYQRATEVALSTLEEKCRQIRSRLWRNNIEELYQRLRGTSFRDKPLLAYLGMKLRIWDYDID